MVTFRFGNPHRPLEHTRGQQRTDTLVNVDPRRLCICTSTKQSKATTQCESSVSQPTGRAAPRMHPPMHPFTRPSSNHARDHQPGVAWSNMSLAVIARAIWSATSLIIACPFTGSLVTSWICVRQVYSCLLYTSDAADE